MLALEPPTLDDEEAATYPFPLPNEVRVGQHRVGTWRHIPQSVCGSRWCEGGHPQFHCGGSCTGGPHYCSKRCQRADWYRHAKSCTRNTRPPPLIKGSLPPCPCPHPTGLQRSTVSCLACGVGFCNPLCLRSQQSWSHHLTSCAFRQLETGKPGERILHYSSAGASRPAV